MLDDFREVFYGGAGGGGKALTLDTRIPTVTGWTTMGDITVGTQVFDEQGNICTVTAVLPVEQNRPIYRVTFDDGSYIDADANHEWFTLTSSERQQVIRRTDEYREKRRLSRPSRSTGKRPDLAERNKAHPTKTITSPIGAIRTTKEIKNTLWSNTGETNHAVPVARSINLPTSELPIAPYTLGLWLGDGDSGSGIITTNDPEVLNYVEQEGYTCHKLNSGYKYRIVGLTTQLNQLEVLHNKHIPLQYLRASIEQRLNLLQGLMDSDGYAKPDGACEFTTIDYRLVYQVQELLLSLGSKVVISEGIATLNGEAISEKYRLTFRLTSPAFKLVRKADKQKFPRATSQSQWRYIVQVEPIDSEPVRCIEVDSPSHLYLAGPHFIPTHNSHALLAAALQYVDVPGYNAIIFRKTLKDLQGAEALLSKSMEWLKPWKKDGVHWDGDNFTWTFPSGAALTFGFIQHENDKYKYQGKAYQFCVAKHTLIKTPQGLKEIQTFKPGDYVSTLEGPRKVTKVHYVGVKPTYIVRTPLGINELSQTHPVFTPDGWVALNVLQSKGLRAIHKSFEVSKETHSIIEPHVSLKQADHLLGTQPVLQVQPDSLRKETFVSLADDQTDYEAFDDAPQAKQPLQGLSSHQEHDEPFPLLLGQKNVQSIPVCVCSHDLPYLSIQGLQCGYCAERGLCDEQLHAMQVNGQYDIPSLNDVGVQIQLYLHIDDQGNTRSHNQQQPEQYFHPYTNKPRIATETFVSADTEIVQAGEAELWDLTVEDVSHYILSSGIISRNCGFDELTQFEESQYLYLHTRMRKLKGYPVPIRIRSAANPGGIGHDWVYNRFINQNPNQTKRIFIPANLWDNPHIDQEDYVLSLEGVDEVLKQQIMMGNWDIRPDSTYFRKDMFQFLPQLPEHVMTNPRRKFVRFWDLASTRRSRKAKDPDYTVGVLMCESNGEYYIIDVERFQEEPAQIERRIRQVAEQDKLVFGHVDIWIEEEPGSSGVSLVDHYIRNVLKGFPVEPFQNKGLNKEKRAIPYAKSVKLGKVYLLRRPWNHDFIKEHEVFPLEGKSIHDDQVDASSGAHHCLANAVYAGSILTSLDPKLLPNIYQNLDDEMKERILGIPRRQIPRNAFVPNRFHSRTGGFHRRG